MITLILTGFAASQLSQVLPAFGQLWQQFFQTLASLLDFTISFKDNGLLFSRLITSIPLALGLFAQLVATYLAKEKPLSRKRFEGRLKTTRQFPKVAAYIVLGSLCLTYALFILTATSQMGNSFLSTKSIFQPIKPHILLFRASGNWFESLPLTWES